MSSESGARQRLESLEIDPSGLEVGDPGGPPKEPKLRTPAPEKPAESGKKEDEKNNPAAKGIESKE